LDELSLKANVQGAEYRIQLRGKLPINDIQIACFNSSDFSVEKQTASPSPLEHSFISCCAL